PEDILLARLGGEDRGWVAGVRAHAGAIRRRSHRASDAGEGRGGMDRAHVSYVYVTASGHSADWRLWGAGGDQEALQEAQVAEAGGDAEDRQAMGAVSVDCLLVSVEEPGCKDFVRPPRTFQSWPPGLSIF